MAGFLLGKIHILYKRESKPKKVIQFTNCVLFSSTPYFQVVVMRKYFLSGLQTFTNFGVEQNLPLHRASAQVIRFSCLKARIT